MYAWSSKNKDYHFFVPVRRNYEVHFKMIARVDPTEWT